MKQEIIAMSGRKQSGKNTACNYLLGLVMTSLGITSRMEVKDDGTLHIRDILIKEVIGNLKPKAFGGQFDVYRNTEAMQNFLAKYLDPFVKVYSFADQLKMDVCIGLLGLSYEGCFGTDEQKDQLTHLKWEDMPGVITNENLWKDWNEVLHAGNEKDRYNDPHALFIYSEPGFMTNREVMKFVGSDIFRRIYNKVWSVSTVKRIKEDGSALALVCDCRFPDEVEEVNKAGGKVIRLTRQINNDAHISESALDKDKYDWNNFYAVLDNSKMSVNEQCKALYEVTKDLQVLPQVN